jgi:hypothetical protein
MLLGRRRLALQLAHRAEPGAARLLDRHPDGDPAQPGAGLVVSGHLLPVPEQLDERLLGDVLGLATVGHDAAESPDQGRAGRDVDRLQVTGPVVSGGLSPTHAGLHEPHRRRFGLARHGPPRF